MHYDKEHHEESACSKVHPCKICGEAMWYGAFGMVHMSLPSTMS
ncbi:hypothetical protein KP509_22G004700 [Ceratopteris richardii]|uniref:Uncharacterized protein n=1 Tax=Ceratopteris richardii TaxID=49495 RepID=A0A8T2S299_CERRI|nr:hypothetical protein KP509_22G004700 [Ceratopteris richardii]